MVSVRENFGVYKTLLQEVDRSPNDKNKLLNKELWSECITLHDQSCYTDYTTGLCYKLYTICSKIYLVLLNCEEF